MEADTFSGSIMLSLKSEAASLFDFRKESVRLASFASWSVSFIKPLDLAAAGFYFLKQQDMCMCAFCAICIEDWDEGDDPMSEHSRLSPDCPFVNVQGTEVVNVPIRWRYRRQKARQSADLHLPERRHSV